MTDKSIGLTAQCGLTKKQREEATKQYVASRPHPVLELPVQCPCTQYPYPHLYHSDEITIFEYHRSLQYVPTKRTKSNSPNENLLDSLNQNTGTVSILPPSTRKPSKPSRVKSRTKRIHGRPTRRSNRGCT